MEPREIQIPGVTDDPVVAPIALGKARSLDSANFAGKWHGFFRAICHAPCRGACGVLSINTA
jgi:hypothetical protein